VATTIGEKGLTEARSRMGAFTGKLLSHLLFERNLKRAAVDLTTLELHFPRFRLLSLGPC